MVLLVMYIVIVMYGCYYVFVKRRK